MKHIKYIHAVILVLGLSFAGCDKADVPGTGDDMQEIEGIVLSLGSQDVSSAEATTRATVLGVNYAVNTGDDPTYTHGNNFITARGTWNLDFDLYNGTTDGSLPYTDASFTKGVYSGGSWKPSDDRQLVFPNYFNPDVEAWLYPVAKDEALAQDQSNRDVFLAQDLLHRPKATLSPITKRISVELQHQRAMLNFKFEGIDRGDIDLGSVEVNVGGVEYIPYSVRETGTLEYMLILPEDTPGDTEVRVEYSTKATSTHQAIRYVQNVDLGTTVGGNLGSNNAYCFTLTGKELAISPITIVNWVTGEPVAGQYVAVTAYPTFKGPKNSTYYFYYDNKLTEDGTHDGTPKLQKINFNNDGECTIKPDGRILTHIFEVSNPADMNATPYKLEDPVILGHGQKMYIDLQDILPFEKD